MVGQIQFLFSRDYATNVLQDPWIRKIGFPVVTVAEEPNQIVVRQTRFLSTGDVKPEEDETVWWIPLGIRTGPGLAKERPHALISKSDVIRDINEEFYKINKDQSGFYRTNYPPHHLTKLGQSLDFLSTEDRIGLVGDVGALAVSGDSTTAALLAFLENFGGEENHL
jgi:aminopeptidase N